jgi:hypothetical protein
LLAEVLDHVVKTGPPTVSRERQHDGGQHAVFMQLLGAWRMRLVDSGRRGLGRCRSVTNDWYELAGPYQAHPVVG